jgi:hypothetical protein
VVNFLLVFTLNIGDLAIQGLDLVLMLLLKLLLRSAGTFSLCLLDLKLKIDLKISVLL